LKLGQRNGVELIWGVRRHEKFILPDERIKVGFRYPLQPPGGAATEGKSECVSGQRLNANDFRMILAGNDTKYLRGYQEKKCRRCRDQGFI